MPDLTDTALEDLEPAARACLVRTRSAVLNVLVGVGVIVALTGWMARRTLPAANDLSSESIHRVLMGSLIAIFVLSTLARRMLGNRVRLRDPGSRQSRFYSSHLLAAIIGAAAAPLGAVELWMVSPRLESILPFWIAALVLGVLAYPRGRELEGFDSVITLPGGPAS